MSCEFISDIKANSHSPSFDTSGAMNSTGKSATNKKKTTPKAVRTGPKVSGLCDHKPDMLRTFFHLTGEIECSGDHQIRVGMSYLVLSIKPFDVYLSRSECLLSS